MKLTFSTLFILLMLSFNPMLHAQKNNTGTTKKSVETKIVRDCDYEVLKGLAEIVEVTKTKDKSLTLLGHDEYRVQFNFIAMDNMELVPELKKTVFDFYLYSNFDKIPVGPEYLSKYQVIKGQKIAMDFLQNKTGSCKEPYAYESKGMPNDLFESGDNLIEYKKQLAANKLREKESILNPTQNTEIPEVKSEPKVEKPNFEINEDSLRKVLEEQLRNEAGLNNNSINVDSLRAALEAEFKAEEERKAEEKRRMEEQNALKEKKLLEEKQKEEERRRLELERLKQEAIDAKKAELEKELRVKILAEIEEKKRKEEMLKEQIAKELRRTTCTYKDKVNGTIEITSIDKVKEKESSLWGYAEYEIKLIFTPDNSGDYYKDKSVYGQVHTLKIDPSGKNANPGANYVRKHQVYTGQKFKGQAQVLVSGICENLIISAPELPVDASQINN